MARWSPLTDEGWTLVLPRWETLADLREHLEECVRRRGLDPERIVIAGVGEGGSFAVELADAVGRPCVSVSEEEPLSVIALRARKSLYG